MRRQHRFLLVLLWVGSINAVEWDSNNYPNPTTQAGAKLCGLRSAGKLCDPDSILTEAERYRVNHELSRLESKTYQEFGRNFCEKKGITGVIGLARKIKGGTEANVQMAADLRQRWSLDEQCKKGVVMIISIDDRKHFISRETKTPVYVEEFTSILKGQESLFREKQYQQALLNIIQETSNKALSKQGQLPAVPDNSGKSKPGPKAPTGDGGFKMPSIPPWVILAIVLVVIPLLLCCCCLYCCFCRSKDGGNRRQGPSDTDDPESQQRNTNGGIMDTLRGMLSGAGGAMAMNLIQNCFRNRNAGNNQPYGGDNRGGYVPPRPEASEGKGLYPSKEVKETDTSGGW